MIAQADSNWAARQIVADENPAESNDSQFSIQEKN